MYNSFLPTFDLLKIQASDLEVRWLRSLMDERLQKLTESQVMTVFQDGDEKVLVLQIASDKERYTPKMDSIVQAILRNESIMSEIQRLMLISPYLAVTVFPDFNLHLAKGEYTLPISTTKPVDTPTPKTVDTPAPRISSTPDMRRRRRCPPAHVICRCDKCLAERIRL
jgi:hypothetical protein